MIRLRPLLTESVTIQGVRLQAKAPKTGGGILATYGDMQQTYRVSVDTAFYDGPVGVTAIWEKSPGNYAIADNTGKTFLYNIERPKEQIIDALIDMLLLSRTKISKRAKSTFLLGAQYYSRISL
jgi:hypothetical protein